MTVSLKPFRTIPADLKEWARWMKDQELGQDTEIADLQAQIDAITGTAATVVSKTWPFTSPSGSSGTYYFAGYYQYHGSSFTPAGGTAVGTANSAYAAHVSFVLGAASTNMVISVTGTSITDGGVRTGSDVETIDTSGGGADTYYETSKKFIGQVSVALSSGTGVVVNAFFSKYFDFGNTNFTVNGLEVLWLAGANDSGLNIELLHHKSSGWTYGAGGTPTVSTAIAAMATDHSTERNAVNGESGAWKRTNLDTFINASGSEGIMWRLTTTANKAIEIGALGLDIQA